jgi:hypothetical protein
LERSRHAGDVLYPLLRTPNDHRRWVKSRGEHLEIGWHLASKDDLDRHVAPFHETVDLNRYFLGNNLAEA